MRLKVDIYFDGKSDFEFMLEAVPELVRSLGEVYMNEELLEPKSLVFPLGTITLTKELNPISEECDDCDDNDYTALNI